MHRWSGMLVVMSALLVCAPQARGQNPAAATWEGAILIPNAPLEVSITLRAEGDGWTGTIDIPAQGARGLPLGNIVVDGEDVSFVIQGVPGNPSFRAAVSGDENYLVGEFSQGAATFPFEFTRRALPTRGSEPSRLDTDLLDGTWQGTLDAGGFTLRVIIHIARDANGIVSATMDSPDQGATGLAVDQVVLEGSTVRLGMPTLGVSYEGTLDAEAGTIDGTWRQGAAALPLVLERGDDRVVDETSERRGQEPQPPFPYDEEEVTFDAASDVTLAGTLTLPAEDGPHPAALMITGSGAQDRNETIFGHKPFLVLADYLTRRGIAVLRVDDRGVGGSKGSMRDATTLDLAGDARAGVDYLRNRHDIDSSRIGLIGHSEGGAIASLVASESGEVAFVVMLAGPGLSGEEVVYLQVAGLTAARGAGETAIEANLDLQERIFGIIKEEPADRTARARLRELAREVPAAAAAIERDMENILTPWYRFFLTYDPATAVSEIQCPVLALNGALDLQVPAAANLAALEAALERGNNSDYRTVSLPGLNHLFQNAETGHPSEYGRIEETMSPDVLDMIADWIEERSS